MYSLFILKFVGIEKIISKKTSNKRLCKINQSKYSNKKIFLSHVLMTLKRLTIMIY